MMKKLSILIILLLSVGISSVSAADKTERESQFVKKPQTEVLNGDRRLDPLRAKVQEAGKYAFETEQMYIDPSQVDKKHFKDQGYMPPKSDK